MQHIKILMKNLFDIRILITGLLFFLICIPTPAHAFVEIYPASLNAVTSNLFSITVDEQETNVIKYMDYHYMHIGFDGEVRIVITINENINDFKISPLSLNIAAEKNNNQLEFKLSQLNSDDETPLYLVVQINNLEKLVILGDLPEKNIPDINDKKTYNITDPIYSADPEGKIFAQTAIQQAIDDAYNAGGGIVYIPYGLYMIKENLALKDNVELYLAPGAVLKAIDIRNEYEQNSTLPPAVIIHKAKNAKITGRGEIDGSGYKLMSPPAGFTFQSVQHPRRRVIQLDDSESIELNGIIIKDGTGWTLELMRSQDLDIQNVKILNHKDIRYKIENDGINAVSSSNIRVNQCFVITIDDAYCSKARYEDMDNCIFSNNICYNRSGGVKAGMQSVGNMTNILFKNCDVIHCRRGIAVDTREGMQPITNVEFRDIHVEEAESTISGGNYAVEFESKLAPISDIRIVRLTCYDTNKIKFAGTHPINNIIFEDLRIDDKLIGYPSQLNITKGNNINVTYRFITSEPVEPDETYIHDPASPIVNYSFEFSSEGVLNDGTPIRGKTPYGWQDTGGIKGESYGVNNDATEKDGNNVCWYNSTPMPDNFELYQEIEGLEEGRYTVQCKMAVDNGKITTQRLFANNSVQYYGKESDYGININKDENYTFASWAPSTATPLELREMEVEVDLAQGEKMRIGVRTNNINTDGSQAKNNAGWFKADHFRLKRHEESAAKLIKDDNFFWVSVQKGDCSINLTDNCISAHIKIFSIQGHKIYEQTVNQQNTNVSLPQGLYIIKVSAQGMEKAVKVSVL